MMDGVPSHRSSTQRLRAMAADLDTKLDRWIRSNVGTGGKPSVQTNDNIAALHVDHLSQSLPDDDMGTMRSGRNVPSSMDVDPAQGAGTPAVNGQGNPGVWVSLQDRERERLFLFLIVFFDFCNDILRTVSESVSCAKLESYGGEIRLSCIHAIENDAVNMFIWWDEGIYQYRVRFSRGTDYGGGGVPLWPGLIKNTPSLLCLSRHVLWFCECCCKRAGHPGQAVELYRSYMDGARVGELFFNEIFSERDSLEAAVADVTARIDFFSNDSG